MLMQQVTIAEVPRALAAFYRGEGDAALTRPKAAGVAAFVSALKEEPK
jgi:hypothetical protein